jgi:hypothetical protein
MNPLDMLKGWRTVIFNMVMFLAGMVTLWTGVDVAEDGVKMAEGIEMLLTGFFAVWTIGSLWLRYITDSPIFSKEVSYHYAKNKK